MMRLIANRTNRTAVVVLTSFLAVSCGGSDPQKVKQEALSRGNEFVKTEKYGEAIIEYRRALQADPQFGEAHRRLAEALLQTKDIGNAVREYIRAADLIPEDEALQIQVGNLLLAGGRFDDARVRAEKVLERNQKNAAARVLRGNALAGLKDLPAALADMEKALADDPGKATTLANMGLLQQMTGDKAKAEEAFTSAIQTDPADVAVRLAYANFLLQSQRPTEAEQQLLEAYNRERKNVLVNRALAVFYASQNKPKEAEQYLKQLADLTGDLSAQFALVQLYAATGRRPDADRMLAGLKARKEASLDATLIMARLAYADKDTARAYSLVNEALTASPKDGRVLVIKGQLDLVEHKPADALAAGKQALASDPNLVDAWIVQGEAYRAQREFELARASYQEALRLRPANPMIQVALAQLTLATGQVQEAKQLAQGAMTTAPTAPIARLTMARTALASGDLGRAQTELDSLSKDFPKAVQVVALQGALLLAKKDMAGAERAYKQAEALDPASLDAAAGLTALDINAKRAPAARARIERLLTSAPKNVDVLLLAARSYAMMSDLPAAEGALRKAVELDSARAEPYALLAQIYLTQSKLDEALKEFQTLDQKQAKKSVGVKTMIAAILQTQNKRGDAEKVYRDALAIDGSAPVAANNLAWMIAEDNGNLDEALQFAQAARTKMPDSAEVIDTLGWVYYKKGLHAQAADAFRESVAKQPTSPAFQYHLGLASAKAGQYAVARKALETALKLDPKSIDADEAKKELARLATLGS